MALMKALAGHWDESMTEYYTSVRENPRPKQSRQLREQIPNYWAFSDFSYSTRKPRQNNNGL